MNNSQIQPELSITDQLVNLLQPSSVDGEFTYSQDSLHLIEAQFKALSQSNARPHVTHEVRELSDFFATEGKAPAASAILNKILIRFFPETRDLGSGKSSIEPSMRQVYGDLIQGPRHSLAAKFAPAPLGAFYIKAGLLAPIAA
jgi:hypothetical protein